MIKLRQQFKIFRLRNDKGSDHYYPEGMLGSAETLENAEALVRKCMNMSGSNFNSAVVMEAIHVYKRDNPPIKEVTFQTLKTF